MILDVVVVVRVVVQRKLMTCHQVNRIGGAMPCGGLNTCCLQPVFCERLADTIGLVATRILIERIVSGRAVVLTTLMGVLLVIRRVLEGIIALHEAGGAQLLAQDKAVAIDAFDRPAGHTVIFQLWLVRQLRDDLRVINELQRMLAIGTIGEVVPNAFFCRDAI
ncbi:hypothetical protein PsAD46_02650 [Pseudovibrio sp. Ad46]|nr:hypothetical protein PsAD46_02650 [Pseudovibrio sp. Ad46]